MADPYSPRIELHGSLYFPPPFSGLTSNTVEHGLIPIGILATCSVASTIMLIAFILYRIYVTRTQAQIGKSAGHNQYVLLVLNLLIADLQQSAAFLFSFHWYRMGYIISPYPPCFAQGWLLHSGDVGSGFFVLAIAVHTYYTAVYGRRFNHKAFGALVGAIWLFTYLLTALGPLLHGERYFVKAGAWCWVSAALEKDRLSLHYVWVFIVEGATIITYFTTFFILRRKTKLASSNRQQSENSPTAATISSINRVAMLMVLYPFVYILLTLPLSVGRMWSMSHHSRPTSDAYSIVASCLLTSCGWVDSLLYSLTRSRLLKSTEGKKLTPRARSASNERGITQTKTIEITSSAWTEQSKYGVVVDIAHHPLRTDDWGLRYSPSSTDGWDAILSRETHGSRVDSVCMPPIAHSK